MDHADPNLVFDHSLPRIPIRRGRMDGLVSMAAGKRVLHVGCTDAGLTASRLQSGELLHARLAAVAQDLWGVDVDEQGLQALRSLGYGQLIKEDVTDPDWFDELRTRQFDLIIASEIVEHLYNPGQFLTGIRKAMSADTKLVITVPNAYGISQLCALFDNREFVHPDHNFWFSYTTLNELLRKAGFSVADAAMYSFQPRIPRPGRIRRVLMRWILYRRSPHWADGIIVVAQPVDEPNFNVK